jgi:hypothetical protein
VLEGYSKVGIDLSGVININETANKPDKLAIITALHLIKNKCESSVKKRPKKVLLKIIKLLLYSNVFVISHLLGEVTKKFIAF